MMPNFNNIYPQPQPLYNYQINTLPGPLLDINQQQQQQRQNHQVVFTSSSSASSINELSAINIGGLADNSSKQNLLVAEQRNRKQHTLDSIGNEKSRSRSPLVDTPTNASNNSIDNLALDRRASNNPFKDSIGGFNNDNVHQIAPLGATSSGATNIDQPRESNQLFKSEDNLSLDRILANIQSQDELSKINLSMNQCSLNTNDHSFTVGTNATELQEFTNKLHHEAENSHRSTSYLSSSLPSSSDLSSSGSTSDSHRKRKKKVISDRENEKAFGFEIVWLNFTYTVVPNIFEDPRWGKINSLFHKEQRTILKGLSGGLKSGQMVALMGPSGAGKTCLLECISGVRMTGIGGELKLRGRKKAQLVIVPQYDNFMPQFTVEEIINYGSKMKNPQGADHGAITNQVIEQLGLQACRSNNILKCSGGQRKRVAIAQELVSRPNILILDEPTSGLDSSCCYQTMKVLRDVIDQSINTEQPMAIVTTIHQPSAKVFKMFDLVYLLGKTGYMAYSGPPDELLATIKDVTSLECPQYSNPSDYMIELVSYDYGEEAVEKLIEFEKEKASMFLKQYNIRAKNEVDSRTLSGSREDINNQVNDISKVPTENQESTCNGSSSQLKLKGSKSDTHLMIDGKLNGSVLQHRLLRNRNLWSSSKHHVKYKQNISLPLRKATSLNRPSHPFFWHIFVHFHRSFLQSIRDPVLNNMRILIHIGFATLLVLLFGKKSGEARGCPPILGLPTELTDPNNDNMIDLADNVGYLFMCIMMITYVSLMSTVLTFPIDIKTVGKEYKNGWYGTITYFLGKTIADLPFIIGYPVVYCLITWFVTKQAQDHYWRYFSFTGLIIMNAMNSQSFGLILGALFVNSVTAATFLGPIITIPWYLFTGFTKRVHRLAEPFKTTSSFLFTRYVFEGLLDTVYGHHRCNCSEFLEKYYELRYEEAIRLGKLISAETLSSLDYYDGIDTIAGSFNKTIQSSSNQWFGKAMDAASTVFADGEDLNLAALMDTNVKASSLFSFGLDFEPTCPSNYKNYIMEDFRLKDDTTRNAFITTLGMLAVIRVLTFLVVTWKIRTREL